MIELAALLHYITIVSIVALPALGVSYGQGAATKHALNARIIQPAVASSLNRMLFISLALMETAAILGICLAILLVFDQNIDPLAYYPNVSRIGIILALSLSGMVSGFVSPSLTRAACHAVTRQPFFDQKISNMLFLTQSLLQTPLIFCFVVAWFIKSQAATATSIEESMRLIASGLAIGLGCIGPMIGLALFSSTALTGLGVNRKAYTRMVTFILVSEAIIEAPILFAFIISLVLLFTPLYISDPLLKSVITLGAALAVGIGSLAPGISSGRIAATASQELARQPEESTLFSRASLIGQAFVDTFVVYATIIAFLMLIMHQS